MKPLELDRPRDLGDLVTLSFNVFTRHFTPLFTLAMIVVTPYVILINGVWARALADGRELDVGQALRAGFEVVVPAAAAVALAAIGITAGALLLVLPGIWLAVRWAFVAQAVVVGGERGVEAVRASAGLVDGNWWATCGRLLVLNLVGAAIGLVTGLPAAAITNGVVYVVLITIGTAASVAYTSVAVTVLFFDRIARRSEGMNAP